MAVNDDSKQTASGEDASEPEPARVDSATSDNLDSVAPQQEEGSAADDSPEPVVPNQETGESDRVPGASEAPDALASVAGQDTEPAVTDGGEEPSVRVASAAGSTGAGRTTDRPAAGNSAAQGQFFPLDDDLQWQYQVEITRTGREPQKVVATKSNKGTKRISGKEYVRVVTTTEPALPRGFPDQFYRLGSKGVYAAVQGASGAELLILPADPAALRSWTGKAPPAITELVGKATVNESYRCEDRLYEGCVKVSLTMKIVERSLFGQRTVSVGMDRWFARGVGMVAEVREVGEKGKPNYVKTVSTLKHSDR
jgi:hypothetical protein